MRSVRFGNCASVNARYISDRYVSSPCYHPNCERNFIWDTCSKYIEGRLLFEMCSHIVLTLDAERNFGW